MARHQFRFVSLFLACPALWASVLLGASASRPNIVLILADDLGYGDVGAYNPDSKIPTPRLDQLAREGMRFTDAHSNSSVCSPTRYGILTGRNAYRTRLKSRVAPSYHQALIPEDRATLASLLKAEGYQTACVGKWHLGMTWPTQGDAIIPHVYRMKKDWDIDFTRPIENGPLTVGFDHFFGIAGSANIPPFTFVEDDRVVELPTSEKPEDWYGIEGAMAPGWTYEAIMPELTRRAADWIRKASKESRPFFLYMPLTAPHTPIAPSERYQGRSEAGPYGDFVAEVDGSVGEILRALEQSGSLDQSVVFFTSDNGSPARAADFRSINTVTDEYGHRPNGPWRGVKADIHEAGHRVPFLVRWPGVVAPETVHANPVSTTDFLATVAEIVDAELTADAGEDSFSFLSAMKGGKHPTRPYLTHHSFDGMFAIRQGDWKLIEDKGSGGFTRPRRIPSEAGGQLYNLADDPGEARNLWNEEPEVVLRLSRLLEQDRERGFSRPGAEESFGEAFISRLEPAPAGGGFAMDGYWVWGMSVIRGEDGRYHGYASRWSQDVGFGNWVTNSEIVHAVADRPEGPYRFSDVVFEKRGQRYWDGMMTHNPTIHKIGDTYLLYYIGTTYDFPFPARDRTDAEAKAARSRQRIGLATSESPYGPWRRLDEPILKPRPGKWDALITVNPAVCVRPDGSILLIYKSTSHSRGLLKLGVASAESYSGPYRRLREEPIFAFENQADNWGEGAKHVEDPYIWWNGEQYELVMKDMRGNICGEKGGGIHATSRNGIDWEIFDPPMAYSRQILWDNGELKEMSAFERPQLLIENGKPTHLFAATGENVEGEYWRFERTWNMVVPLRY